MAELEQTLETSQENSRSQERIKQLSDKVELTAKERDEIKTLKEQSDSKAAEAEKERDFYKGFADVVSDNPAAKEHKDEILAKVKAGYTVEDATIAVLAKAGKYSAPQQQVERPTVAGGSAGTQIPSSSQKPVSEMSREEKRAALVELEKRGELNWLIQ